MVIITEEEDNQKRDPKPSSSTKPTHRSKQSKPTPSSPSPTPTPPPSKPPQEVQSPFAFWFYFTITVSIITFFFISFSSLSPQDPKSWFLSLPTSLRQFYSKGRTIKVQTHPDQSAFEVFTAEKGVTESEKVIIVHGLGLSSYSFRKVIEALGSRGVHVVAFDLPGNGFSDKSTVEIGENPGGLLGRFSFVVSEIQEKGLFWAFDEIVATGQVPFEEIEARASKRKVVKPIELGPEEVGKVLGQVIETMGLAPVHLVLHDSALGMVSNWVLENVQSVRSVTLIDTGAKSAGALPLWVLEVPLVRELVLGFSYAHALLIKMSCSSGVGSVDLNAHRVLLKGRDGTKAIVGMGKKLNRSFDIAEWGGSDGLKGVPMQLLWSEHWSKEWSEEGRRIANALPKANFVTHSGGRWPQEDAADEVAGHIANFVTSLPATVRKVAEEPIPEHIQTLLDEAEQTGHGHLHGHAGHEEHSHGHVHGAGAGYPDPYGLGHGHGW
ncbi:putative alpha/Beta hydrolase [Rosa chinensis]|uniref:Putative alpha/Beta hydrolase n=1 Tax=Rosa chinensis TaxID=74649 RepID=A0A2P6R6X5_ROSCH|nr:protein AUXIN RESPONSE 4 [Rosa chinensis]PRQ42196.1 putative alpha/Beta hydrolase [Rosa chinensis]